MKIAEIDLDMLMLFGVVVEQRCSCRVREAASSYYYSFLGAVVVKEH